MVQIEKELIEKEKLNLLVIVSSSVRQYLW